MYCSPLLHPAPTIIPTAIRDWLGARLSGPPPAARRRQRQACVFALGWIGDLVLTLSAVRLLVREFGPEGCVLVVAESAAPLTAREFPGVQCITLPPEAASLLRDILPAWWHERRKFSEDQFQRLVCLSHQRALYYEVTLSWIAAEEDIRLMPETYPLVASDGLCTELLAHWRLVETVLGRPVSREDILPSFTSLYAGDDGRLLIYPLSRQASRCLPVSRVIEVLCLWRERSRASIVFGGSPNNAAQLECYAAAARLAGLDNVSIESPPNIDGLLQHVAQAGAVLATDTAAAHIATALDKPTLVMMDGTLQGYCCPWWRSEKQQLVLNKLPADKAAAALPAL